MTTPTPRKPSVSWATRPLRSVGPTAVEYDGPGGTRLVKEFTGVKASRAFYAAQLKAGTNPRVRTST